MTKNYRIAVNTAQGEETTVVNADTSRPVRLKVQTGARYQLRQVDEQTDKITSGTVRVKRVGKDLHVLLDDSQTADLILEDYYDVMPADTEGLLGLGEDGQLHAFMALDPSNPVTLGTLPDGADTTAFAMTDAPAQDSAAALAVLAAAPAAFSPALLVAAGLAAGAAAGGGGGGGGGTSAAQQAIDTIKAAAEANNATSTSPDQATYVTAGVSGVNAGNLAGINSVLDTLAVNGAAVDSAAKIQGIVDAYNKVQAAANGVDGDSTNLPTADDYTKLGITGVNSNKASLLSDVVDGKAATDVDTAGELQDLANAVGTLQGYTGGTAQTVPTLQQLQALASNPGAVTGEKLAAILGVIAAANSDGTPITTQQELQSLVDNAVNRQIAAANTIQTAAENNSATNSTPSVADYLSAGAKGVDSNNLVGLNTVLNTTAVNGAAVDTTAELQGLVDAYNKVQAAANGQDGDSTNLPSQSDYEKLGITGLNPSKAGLLSDVVDGKAATDVDTASELQTLANTVGTLQGYTGAPGQTAPTLEQLQTLASTPGSVTSSNLAAVLAAIAVDNADGTPIASQQELQNLINNATANQAAAIDKISTAAQNNTATETSPTLSDYLAAGAVGVDTSNLAAINSALNTPNVNGESVNTLAEIQGVVDAYKKVLDAANGKDGDATRLPTADDYAKLGITGLDANKAGLLSDVVDGKVATAVDSAPELQTLANAVSATVGYTGGAGQTAPTLEQLKALASNPAAVSTNNLAAVLNAIAIDNADGTPITTQAELQNLIDNAVGSLEDALKIIQAAAEDNTATATSPSLVVYAKAGISGVSASNLAAINSVLDTAAINGASVDDAAKIQSIVDTYQKVLSAADGNDSNTPGINLPTAADYAKLGITGLDSGKAAMLSDVVDGKASTAVDTAPELQDLANAVGTTLNYTGGLGQTAPTLNQLKALAIDPTTVTQDKLAAILGVIAADNADGTPIASQVELQDLINNALFKQAEAFGKIESAAQNNTATPTSPALTDYLAAGATGVDASNLAAINSALNTPNVNGVAVDTLAELQGLVDAYNKVLGAADGSDGNTAAANLPSAADYAKLGITGLDAGKAALLGDVIDGKASADVDSAAELQALVNDVNALQAYTGDPAQTAPTLDQIQALASNPAALSVSNLAAVQAGIAAANADGTPIATQQELQSLIDNAVENQRRAVATISAAAEDNSATTTSPSVVTYAAAGVKGVNAGNLAAVNSALDTLGVNGAAVDTVAEIQGVVDAYKKVLAAADGTDNNASAKPTLGDYSVLGITGLDAGKAGLLSDVVDGKATTDVDSAGELQTLANAVSATVSYTGATGQSAPTLDQIKALASDPSAVTSTKLTAILGSIAAANADGTPIATQQELQDLIDSALTRQAAAIAKIQAAADANNATDVIPTVIDYLAAGATGVDTTNLAALNSVLDSIPVNGLAVDTLAEIQGIVDAYKKVLAAADGTDGNTAAAQLPTLEDYTHLGVTGLDTGKAALLGDVIDGKVGIAVDSVPELQALANAVAATVGYTGSAGQTAPTLEQIKALASNPSTLTDGNLAAVQTAIANANADGTPIATQQELQGLIDGAINNQSQALGAIIAAAQNNTANETSPSAGIYALAGVSGVNTSNLAAINSVLNTNNVDGVAVDTTAEIQTLVDIYNKVLGAADGTDNNAANKPTASEYAKLGLTGITSTTAAMLSDVVDGKVAADVNSVAKLQALADATASVLGYDDPSVDTAPTAAQINALVAGQTVGGSTLGANPVSADALAAVLAAIDANNSDGSVIANQQELASTVKAALDAYNSAIDAIKTAAENNTASATLPSAAQYSAAGVTGVDVSNLAAINSALDSAKVNGAAADTAAEVQGIVDAYKKVLAAADSNDNNATSKPTEADYAKLGVTGIDAQTAALLSDVIDGKATADVNTVVKLQDLTDAASTVLGYDDPSVDTVPTPAQINALIAGQTVGGVVLGANPVSADALPAVLAALDANNSDGSVIASQQELANTVKTALDAYTSALAAIKTAAENNTATPSNPSLAQYTAAGVNGVDASNLAAVNSTLNSTPVNGAAADTAAEVQAIVDAYKKVLAAADGNDNNSINKPTNTDYTKLGVSGVDSVAKGALLSDVVDGKVAADVDSVPELQTLANAVVATVGYTGAAGQTAPTLAQIQALASNPSALASGNLVVVQSAIAAANADGTPIATQQELQDLIDSAILKQTNALNVISTAAQNNTANASNPSLNDYADAGVRGVDASNLAAINSALDSAAVNGAAADTTAEVQALVDAYKKVLAAADGTDNNAVTVATNADYTLLGVTGVDTAAKGALLSDVVDGKVSSDVDSVGELQTLANAVNATIAYTGAVGQTAPTMGQIQALINNPTALNSTNLAVVQAAIAGANADGTPIATQQELQNLINTTIQKQIDALNTISTAAQNNTATTTSPSLSDYANAGVSGVDASNLPAINSALDSVAVNGLATDTPAEIQAIVDAYKKVLAAADGTDNNAALAATNADYTLLGVTGVDTAAKGALLSDVVDGKAATAVDTVGELQTLADAVNATVGYTGAAGQTAPTLTQIQSLATNPGALSATNLVLVQAAIANANADGTPIATQQELQSLIDGTIQNQAQALATISAAAEANNATTTSPSAGLYATAGVTGVDASNLAAINSALNSGPVNGAAADTTAELQTIVDAYKAILLEANGSAPDATPGVNPSAAQYASIGANIGLASTDAENLALLNDIVGAQAAAGVDTITEIEGLARIANAIQLVAAGGTPSTGLTANDFSNIGLSNVTADNLQAVLGAIAAKSDSGTETDTLPELQALINTAVSAYTSALEAIKTAAQNNNATTTSPDLGTYAAAGVNGVTSANLAAINSVLNSTPVDGSKADTAIEVQGIVDAYKQVLSAADGTDNNTASRPTLVNYTQLGVTGLDNTTAAFLGDVVDGKTTADVDSFNELQTLADAVKAVLADLAVPTAAQVNLLVAGQISGGTTLGANEVSDDALAAVRAAIVDASPIGNQQELADVVKGAMTGYLNAMDVIYNAAQSNTASATSPSLATYAAAGITGLNSSLLASVNSALNSVPVNGAAVGSAAEVQGIVDAYAAIRDATLDSTVVPTAAQYQKIGVTLDLAATDAENLGLLNDIVHSASVVDVDTIAELNNLARIANAVEQVAAGGTPSSALTVADLTLIGLDTTALTTDNLKAVLGAIAAKNDNGSETDTLAELQAILDGAVTAFNTAINKIETAAEGNTATESNPSVGDYAAVGVSGVSLSNLAAVNSALNSDPVAASAVNTAAKVQGLVDAYAAILAEANGSAPDATPGVNPTAAQYQTIGVTLDAAASDTESLALLNDIVAAQLSTGVDTIAELNNLARIANAIQIVAAGGTPSPALSATDMAKVGLSNVTTDNLPAVLNAIAAKNDSGSETDTLPELQAIIDSAVTAYNTAINTIKNAAQNNTANPTTPDLTVYAAAGVSGVNASNLAAINDALNSTPVDGAAADTAAEVQGIVNAYQAILAEANGNAPDATPGVNPTVAQYQTIGVALGAAASDAENLALLDDIVATQTTAGVDTIGELNELARIANAVQSVAAGGSTALTAIELGKIGLNTTNITTDNLSAVLSGIAAKSDTGVETDTLVELQAIIDNAIAGYNSAIDTIKSAAEANNATNTTPSLAIYAAAGVKGVDAETLIAINSALNTAAVNGAAVDTAAEVQAIVDAYKTILAEANASAPDATPGVNPTVAQYASIGASIGLAATDTENLTLLNDIVGVQDSTEVDTVPEINNLARIANAIEQVAAGGTPNPALTPADFTTVGLTIGSADSLPAILSAIAAKNDNGTETDTLAELQAIINAALVKYNAALDAIQTAARDDTATPTSPSLSTYADAGVSGVDASNLAAVNSALNSQPIDDVALNTAADVQGLVNAYKAILAEANGSTPDATPGVNPTAAQYAAIGANIGLASSDTENLTLLNDIVGAQSATGVDTIAEIEGLARIANAIQQVAAGGTPTPALTLTDFSGLGLINVTTDNLPAVLNAIAAKSDTGTETDTLAELQAIINTANTNYLSALNTISNAAQNNTATAGTLDLTVYAAAGVSGVDASNLAAINSALDSGPVNGAAADTAAEVQGIVNAYKAILAEANGSAPDATPGVNPTALEYSTIGVTLGPVAYDDENLALLNDIVGAQASTGVASIPELNELARIANAIQSLASDIYPSTALTAADMAKIGLTGVTDDNLSAIQIAIIAKNNTGTETDTLAELQAIIDAAIPKYNAAIAALKNAAENNTASLATTGVSVYLDAGVVNVISTNIDAINSALNSTPINGAKADTAAEVQAIVDAYDVILAEANGSAPDATPGVNPTAAQYATIGANIGLAGTDAENLALLDDAVAAQATTGVDTIAKIENLARITNAVQQVAAGGSPSPALTIADLNKLGLNTSSITTDNLPAVLLAIAGKSDTGTETDTLAELQAIIDSAIPAFNTAINTIRDAAQNNTATADTPDLTVYVAAGVSGVDASNLAAINSALDSGPITGATADTSAEVQAIVNAYKAILAEANGSAPDATPGVNPTAAQYAAIGANIGLASSDTENLALLNDSVGAQVAAGVDTIAKIDKLAGIANAIEQVAAGGTPSPALTVDDLTTIGLNTTGLTVDNLPTLLAAIAAKSDNGTETDSLPELQAIIDGIDKVAPVFSSGTTASVDENAAISTVVYDATADSDVGVTYTLTGTDAAAFNINATTGEVRLNTSANYEVKSSYNFNVVATDGAHNAANRAVTLSINNVNEAPVNTVPAAQTTSTNTALVINGLSVADGDGTSSAMTVTLSVAHGTLNVASGTGVTISTNGTGSVQLSGTVSAIDALLATANAVTYTPASGYNGSDTLTMLSSDGTLTDSDTVGITVKTTSVELSDVEQGIGGYAVLGDVANRHLAAGGAMYSAGDVNGDGYEDFVVGSRNGISPDTGAAWVLFGKAGNTNTDLAALGTNEGFKIINSAAPTGANTDGVVMGARVVGGGDFNGDGLADLLVAEPNTPTASSTYVGKVWAVYGKANGTTVDVASLGANGFTIAGADGNLGQQTGVDVAVGDVNGDGLSDIIVRKFYESATASPAVVGSTYVIYGAANQAGSTITLGNSTINGANGYVIKGSTGDIGGLGATGLTTRYVGDVNGDGYGDLLVAAPAYDLDPATPSPVREGRVYVVFGKADNTAINLSDVANGTGGFALNGELQSNAGFGSETAALGDINGDGLADFAVGTTSIGQNGLLSTGRAYVVFGKTGGAAIDMASLTSGSSSQGFTILAEDQQSASMGTYMDGAGDINGDGLGDLIVSATGFAPNGKTSAGRSYVVYGKAGGGNIDLAAIANGNGNLGFVINGACTNDSIGSGDVRAAGDLNGDGFDDLLVGGVYADVGSKTDAGKAYVIFGGQKFASTVDFLGDASANTLTGTSAAETFVGGDGNDTLVGGGGADVMMGGRGSDTLVVDSTLVTALGSAASGGQLAHLNGGTGIDTLSLSGGANLDLTTISNTLVNSRIENIERIDLATDTAANTLSLSARDVNDMAGMNLIHTGSVSADGHTWTNVTGSALSATTAYHQLVVDGSAGDVVNLKTSTGSWASVGTVSDGTSQFVVYQNSATNSQVLVNSGVTVNMNVPPVVIDLNGDGQLSYGQSLMDVNGDGLLDSTPWAGAQDGVLVRDANHDGRVSGMAEFAFARNGSETDLQGLAAQFDSNGDGVLDAQDTAFAEFAVWQDANGNGVSDAGELRSLADLGVRSVGLVSDGVVRDPATGVHEAGRTTVQMSDGRTLAAADASFDFQSGAVTQSALGVFSLQGTGLSLNLDNLRAVGGDVHSVDLTGTGNNTLKLNVQDLLVQPLKVEGNAGDVVALFGAAEPLTATPTTVGGIAYQGYDVNHDGQLDLLVQQAMTVQMH